MVQEAIKTQSLRFGYGRSLLFDDLDLELQTGNIYGLLGKNGAGKTTLLRLMAGLAFPGEGEMRTLGYHAPRRNPGMMEELFFLPEEFYLPAMRADEYLSLYAPFYPRFDYTAMQEYMDEFEIPAGQKLSAFSYGQKKKFILSFGLACGSTIFMLDEPTNGLDIPSKSKFRKLVASAINEERVFIISTHQVRDMEHLIDPVVILENGKIIFNRSVEEIGRKLSVRKMREVPADLRVLYSEEDLSGYTLVTENDGGGEFPSDLELLFNTVVSNSQDVYEVFSKGENDE
jgi:ABC-2 type transport system ATP-binding protein